MDRFVFKYSLASSLSDIKEFWISSGYCLFFVILELCMFMCYHHLHWKKPREQKRILIIVLMPLILCIASYATLLAPDDSKTLFIVFDSIKECCAGVCVAMFLSLLQTYMNVNSANLSAIDIRVKIGGRIICNVFPVTLFQPRYLLLNENNLNFHKYWTWQFVVIRLVCSVFMIVLQLLDIYPCWLGWAFFLIINVSVFLAFSTVFAFYQTFVEDFTWHLAFAKLLYVTGIVFVCFFQGGVLKFLVAMGIIESNHFWQQELHNNLMILEMMFFSFFQWLAYSVQPYCGLEPIIPSKSAAPKHARPIVACAA